jgi:hypothetical protein
MIVEERCYTLKPEFGPGDFLKAYKARGLDVQTRTLGGLLGYFTGEIGELNTVYSLWQYDSLDERQRRRAELAKEPEWQEYLALVRPMIASMTNRVMLRAL